DLEGARAGLHGRDRVQQPVVRFPVGGHEGQGPAGQDERPLEPRPEPLHLAQVAPAGLYGLEPRHEPRYGPGSAVLALVRASLPLVRQPVGWELGRPFGGVPADGRPTSRRRLDLGASRAPEPGAAARARLVASVWPEGVLGPAERARPEQVADRHAFPQSRPTRSRSRSFQTFQTASRTMRLDIFDSPSVR